MDVYSKIIYIVATEFSFEYIYIFFTEKSLIVTVLDYFYV